jgi:hypothetical protein
MHEALGLSAPIAAGEESAHVPPMSRQRPPCHRCHRNRRRLPSANRPYAIGNPSEAQKLFTKRSSRHALYAAEISL